MVMSSGELQRSEAVQKRIEEVQRLKAKTPEEKKVKQEQARLLRMEALLTNAQLAENLVATLEKTPDITRGDFISQAQEEGIIVHPEESQQFIEDLLDTRDTVLQASKELEKEAVVSEEELPRTIFISLSKLFQEPQEKVELFANYPLAIVILVSKEDFKLVDEKKNTGGFWSNSRLIQLKARKRNLSGVPVIVVKRGSLVFEHEQAHGEKKVLEKTLRKSRKYSVVWTTPYSLPKMAQLEKIREWTGKGVPPERWNDLIVWGLSEAKDELLATMKPEPRGARSHLRVLLKRSGLYDYFVKRLVLEGGSESHKHLWQDYSAKLEECTKTALELADFYTASWAPWQKRARIFRWVLAQIPITQWEKQLNETLFIEEKKEANRFQKRYTPLLWRLVPVSGKWDEYQDAYDLHGEVINLHRKLLSEIRENSDKPLLDVFREYNQRLADLEEKAKQTRACRENVAISLFNFEINALWNSVTDAFAPEEVDPILDKIYPLYQIYDDAEAGKEGRSVFEILEVYEKRLEEIKAEIEALQKPEEKKAKSKT